jgi:hypothetical protein
MQNNHSEVFEAKSFSRPPLLSVSPSGTTASRLSRLRQDRGGSVGRVGTGEKGKNFGVFSPVIEDVNRDEGYLDQLVGCESDDEIEVMKRMEKEKEIEQYKAVLMEVLAEKERMEHEITTLHDAMHEQVCCVKSQIIYIYIYIYIYFDSSCLVD